ncbi:unnamed protein product [Miscanthus lutarioriparius]|uniref:Uncharacterized protein n=1 Tax=Miscanthus lutarioriparius TaxID=422564 RepID=A0A811QZY2_9POAL|nr:unnamed protein product [Miscanthus lutarioriparius]
MASFTASLVSVVLPWRRYSTPGVISSTRCRILRTSSSRTASSASTIRTPPNTRLLFMLLACSGCQPPPVQRAAGGELPCNACASARAVEAIQREMAEERTTVGCGAGGIVRAGGELLRAGTQASHLASTSASCRGDRRLSRQPRRADQRALPRRRCSGSPSPQAASATPRRKDSSSRLLSS